jgi:phosphatidylinositol alpha-mannosyltransferase
MPAFRPLRVCLVSAAYHPYPSGVSEHVRHLALGLHRLGQDVAVLTTHFPGDEHNPDPFPVTRFGRAVLVPMNGSYATVPVGLRLGAQVRRYLAGREFDIVHCHGLHWPEIAYWALRHSRSVNIVTFVTAGFRIHTAGSGLYRFLFRGHLGRIRARIAISERARAAAEPYVPGDWRIIPCGVDTERFRPGLPPPGCVGPDASSVKRDAPLILFLGRLDRRKGLAVLLRALPLIRSRVPGARLAVVGSGPLESEARRLARALHIAGAVEFAGRPTDEDLPRWFANADLYCSPALGGETLGIVLLEAMASGAPTIASRIPGYDETIRDGIDGLLFAPGNAAALADAAIRVLCDPGLSTRLRAAGPARAAGYAWPRVCAQTLELYRELLDRRPES